jgi:hypothetical protein
MGNPITLRCTRTLLYVGLAQRLGVALESFYFLLIVGLKYKNNDAIFYCTKLNLQFCRVNIFRAQFKPNPETSLKTKPFFTYASKNLCRTLKHKTVLIIAALAPGLLIGCCRNVYSQ